ncbi:hypothetical protein [Novosphingobium sp.]|uniref:hypothetical protein n=1 Tax=Novosphingobium sp. TaxID=1874826 RepID=UPI0026265988|nr:hypothetical protein [Novosphingobium sp.]
MLQVVLNVGWDSKQSAVVELDENIQNDIASRMSARTVQFNGAQLKAQAATECAAREHGNSEPMNLIAFAVPTDDGYDSPFYD